MSKTVYLGLDTRAKHNFFGGEATFFTFYKLERFIIANNFLSNLETVWFANFLSKFAPIFLNEIYSGGLGYNTF